MRKIDINMIAVWQQVQYPVKSLHSFREFCVFSRFAPTIHQFYQRIMPPQRPLCEISGNRPVNHELTSTERAEIVGAAKCEVKFTDIGRILNFMSLTVWYIYELSEQHSLHKLLLHIDRPSITSERGQRVIV